MVKNGTANPRDIFPAIKKMAEGDDWKVREVATTALVEIGKKKPDAVIAEMTHWADENNPQHQKNCE